MMTTPKQATMLIHAFKPFALISSVLMCCLMLWSINTSAAQLYRYKDDQGNYVLNHTIPPKYVKKGYDILNNQGRVIRSVAPELTAEQIATRDAALEQERIRKLEAEKQAAIDHELKQLYSHPNDAVRVLTRRVTDIEALIKAKLNRIASDKTNILEEEASAASRQRSGLKILDTTHKKLEKYKADIAVNKHDIAELKNELTKVKSEFDKIIRRLEVITGKEASDYPSLLEKFQKKHTPKAEK